jgi:hypothetical protein
MFVGDKNENINFKNMACRVMTLSQEALRVRLEI